jgi:hypothetical protein
MCLPCATPSNGTVVTVVIMPKPRSTIPIAHADDVPTIAITDEQWQAIEHAYGRQLNTEVRQQITIVTTQYLKDCAFDRTVAPKAMARERIERIRRAAGDLEKVMRDSNPFSASTDELSREPNSYADGLIRQHLDERRSRARDKLHHFRNVLKSLIVACDCALHDDLRAYNTGDTPHEKHVAPQLTTFDWLSWTYPSFTTAVLGHLMQSPHWLRVPAWNRWTCAAEYRDGQAWGWWIQGLTRIVKEHRLPAGVSTEVDKNDRPLPFVRLVEKLESYLPADARPRKRSPAALAMAISRARNT